MSELPARPAGDATELEPPPPPPPAVLVTPRPVTAPAPQERRLARTVGLLAAGALVAFGAVAIAAGLSGNDPDANPTPLLAESIAATSPPASEQAPPATASSDPATDETEIAEPTTGNVASTPVIVSDGQPVDAAAIGSAVIPSIVTVQLGSESTQGFREVGSGSGVIIDPSGYIVTNDHVATAGGSVIRVVTSDERIYEAELIGTDPITDLAVLKINADGLEALEYGSTGNLRVGEAAVAIGNPLGLEGGPSLTVGVLSAFGREVQTDVTTILYGMLQTDAPITSGSSGGALVDASGRLIGITTAVGVSAVGVEGIGFATPVEIVERVVDEIIETGAARHALIGITGSTEFTEAADGALVPAGVRIAGVSPGSGAETAGLAAGDILTAIDGYDVDTMDELVARLRLYRAGDTTQLTVQGSGDISVALGEL